MSGSLVFCYLSLVVVVVKLPVGNFLRMIRMKWDSNECLSQYELFLAGAVMFVLRPRVKRAEVRENQSDLFCRLLNNAPLIL